MATADSSTRRAICPIIKKDKIVRERLGPVFPRRVMSKCPAIMFAASRTAKVPGRMTLLIVSIHTMKGINTGGVPWGTKWANICWVWLIQP